MTTKREYRAMLFSSKDGKAGNATAEVNPSKKDSGPDGSGGDGSSRSNLKSQNNNNKKGHTKEDAKKSGSGKDSDREKTPAATAPPIAMKNKNRKKSTATDIAFLTVVDLSGGTGVFNRFIFPALDTWLDDGSVLYVVLLQQWKRDYEKLCSKPEHEDYCKFIEVLWVDCGGDSVEDSVVGAPSCCKVQNGLKKLHDADKSFDWYAYLEPNIYMRKGRVLDAVKQLKLDPQEPLALTSRTARAMGYSDYDDSAYNCTDGGDFNFWYSFGMPVVLSHGALRQMRVALDGGMMFQCQEFGDTAADLGLQIVNWMFSTPALQIAMGHKPVVGNEWFANYVSSTAGMNALHKDATKQPSASDFKYDWHKPKGFHQTELFDKYGDPKDWDEWHKFTTDHCWIKNKK